MPLIIDPDDLNQGAVTTPTDAAWGAPTGREVAISSTALLPDLAANVYFEVRDHPIAVNNGLYRVNEANPTTSLITAFKISGPAPVTDTARTVRIFATAATPKSVFFDTDTRDVYLLEEGNLDDAGVTLQALYSFIKLRWKDDDDLIKHPFPMIAITPEQFEFIDDWTPFDAAVLGPHTTPTEGWDYVDGAGGNDIIRDQNIAEDSWLINGFRVGDTIQLKNAENDASFMNGAHVILAISGASDEDAEVATGTTAPAGSTDDNTATVQGAIRSRKLIRSGGWSEVKETGAVLDRQYPNVTTLGSFEDVLDIAYFQFANDPTDIAAAIDFDFAGPVNEAVLSYIEIGQSGTSYDFNDDSPDTIDLNGGGSFIDDGYQVGGQVTVRAATVGANDGSYEITVLGAAQMTVQAVGGGDAGLSVSLLDTTAQLSVNNRNLFAPRVRIRDADTNGKTFDASNLAAIGLTGADDFNNRVFRFPLQNATDLKITATDADILTVPHTEVRLRYLAESYNRAVDSATLRDFGIVVDVGTYSQANGVSAGTATFTSIDWTGDDGEDLTDYTGGTLTLHDATAPDRAVHTIVGTPTAPGGTLTIVVSVALTNSETSLSFTMERATPLTATAEEIYEKVQFQLRQDADIDSTGNVVTGRTADKLLTFVGDALSAGEATAALPVNPNGGGSGVIIEGFDSNDTNRITFFDNTGTGRTFPFVAAGTITFNLNLQNDTGPAEFFMFYEFTRRTTNADIDVVGPSGDTYDLEGTLGTYIVGDYLRIAGFAEAANNGIFIVTVVNVSGSDYTVRKIDGTNVGGVETDQTVSVDENPIDSPQAILVDDNGGADITGTIGGPSTAFDFDYDNNVQGGRTAATDAEIVIRALGEDIAAFVEVFGTITRAVGLSFSVVAPLERNFTNPA